MCSQPLKTEVCSMNAKSLKKQWQNEMVFGNGVGKTDVLMFDAQFRYRAPSSFLSKINVDAKIAAVGE